MPPSLAVGYAFSCVVVLIACQQTAAPELGQHPEPAAVVQLDPKQVEDGAEAKATVTADGVVRIAWARADVAVKVDGMSLRPFAGLGSWAAFKAREHGAMVMGDTVVFEDEVDAAMDAAFAGGLEVTALHNHFFFDEPKVYFMHVGGQGEPKQLHNHMIGEDPRFYFTHYWGTGPAEELAHAIRSVLDAQQDAAAPLTWDFERDTAGSAPAGWKIETTNLKGPDATWNTMADSDAPSGRKVLTLTSPNHDFGGAYNLCWRDDIRFKDGTLEVTVRADTGDEDQGGGPIWRVQDKNNYYIARYNPLENNFRLYYVKRGVRKLLASAPRLKIKAGEWFTIRIVHNGSRIEGWLNGDKLLEVTDVTLAQAGGVGLWTKADAATSFDDFAVVFTDQ